MKAGIGGAMRRLPVDMEGREDEALRAFNGVSRTGTAGAGELDSTSGTAGAGGAIGVLVAGGKMPLRGALDALVGDVGPAGRVKAGGGDGGVGADCTGKVERLG